MKKIFLISGKLNSGKNKFTEYLKQQYQVNGISVRTDMFAKSLKDNCKEDFKKLIEYLNIKISSIGYYIQEHVRYLNEKYPTNKKYTSEPLNNIIRELLALLTTDDNFYEDKNDITRILLQLYGTEIFRKRVDQNYWVNQLIKRFNESEENVTIVTDVRFVNEVELIDDNIDNVTVIRIEREMERDAVLNQHESETALDDYINWNYIVDNNGTLEQLLESSETIYKELENGIEEITEPECVESES